MNKRDHALIDLLASLTPDEVARQRREAVGELRERGMTLAAIADALGEKGVTVTPAAVGNWLYRTSRRG